MGKKDSILRVHIHPMVFCGADDDDESCKMFLYLKERIFRFSPLVQLWDFPFTLRVTKKAVLSRFHHQP